MFPHNFHFIYVHQRKKLFFSIVTLIETFSKRDNLHKRRLQSSLTIHLQTTPLPNTKEANRHLLFIRTLKPIAKTISRSERRRWVDENPLETFLIIPPPEIQIDSRDPGRENRRRKLLHLDIATAEITPADWFLRWARGKRRATASNYLGIYLGKGECSDTGGP